MLDPQDTKAIFDGIPPIFDVHVKIRDELSDIVGNWREDRVVGDVILKHVRTLLLITLFVQLQLVTRHCENLLARTQFLPALGYRTLLSVEPWLSLVAKTC